MMVVKARLNTYEHSHIIQLSTYKDNWKMSKIDFSMENIVHIHH